MEPMVFLEPQESMGVVDTMESFDQKVERIAKVWFETTCPPEEGDNCCLDLHNWETGHPDDKASARNFVAFVLHEAGVE